MTRLKLNNNCLFCNIVQKEIPADILFQDEELTVFKDINPQAPHHLLFVPNKHIDSLSDLTQDESALIGKLVLKINDIAKKNSWNEKGFRVVNNVGKLGGQTVNHLHFHLLAGRAFEWPPG